MDTKGKESSECEEDHRVNGQTLTSNVNESVVYLLKSTFDPGDHFKVTTRVDATITNVNFNWL
jgi:hypothetical protein